MIKPNTRLICLNNPNNPTGALLTPGACFELEGCARIGYACGADELKAGLAAISQTLDTL